MGFETTANPNSDLILSLIFILFPMGFETFYEISLEISKNYFYFIPYGI